MDPLEAGIVINEQATLLNSLDIYNSWQGCRIDEKTQIEVTNNYQPKVQNELLDAQNQVLLLNIDNLKNLIYQNQS